MTTYAEQPTTCTFQILSPSQRVKRGLKKAVEKFNKRYPDEHIEIIETEDEHPKLRLTCFFRHRAMQRLMCELGATIHYV